MMMMMMMIMMIMGMMTVVERKRQWKGGTIGILIRKGEIIHDDAR